MPEVVADSSQGHCVGTNSIVRPIRPNVSRDFALSVMKIAVASGSAATTDCRSSEGMGSQSISASTSATRRAATCAACGHVRGDGGTGAQTDQRDAGRSGNVGERLHRRLDIGLAACELQLRLSTRGVPGAVIVETQGVKSGHREPHRKLAHGTVREGVFHTQWLTQYGRAVALRWSSGFVDGEKAPLRGSKR
jgi:hypothetical protein